MEQGITVFHKNEISQTEIVPKKPKKGPLNIEEQLALVEICSKHAKYKDIRDYSKNFWLDIEFELEMRIGRPYSHTSCRRRIYDYLSERKQYRDCLELGLNPLINAIHERVAMALDKWMDGNDMEELEKKLQKRKALLKSNMEVSQSSKLQRVADWVRSLPDPGLQVSSSGRTSEPKPLSRFMSSLCADPSPHPKPDASFNGLMQSANGARDNMLVKQEPASPAHNRPALSQSQTQLPLVSQELHGTPHDKKRPRDEDEAGSDRPATRLCTHQTALGPGNSALKESSNDSLHPIQHLFETTFHKFWEDVLPHFHGIGLKQGASIAKSESIFHDLFKDLGSAVSRALLRLEETKNS